MGAVTTSRSVAWLLADRSLGPLLSSKSFAICSRESFKEIGTVGIELVLSSDAIGAAVASLRARTKLSMQGKRASRFFDIARANTAATGCGTSLQMESKL
jgi:hypothetical protein